MVKISSFDQSESWRAASNTKQVSDEKRQAVMNLYLSGIGEEFIALQLDLEIPAVINILKESGVYKGG